MKLIAAVLAFLCFAAVAHATTVDVLDHNANCTSILNSSAETEIYGYDVPGGTIGDAYRGVIHTRIFAGLMNNTGASKNITWRIKWAGVTHYQDNYNVGASAVERAEFLDLYIYKLGVGDQFANLMVQHNYGDSGLPSVGFGRIMATTLSPVVLGTELLDNLSTTARLSVTVQFNAANGNLRYDCYHGYTLKE